MNNNSNNNNNNNSNNHNNNNNNSLLNRNKSHSIIGLHSSKYESPLKENYSSKNVNLKNQLLNGGIKSDTYESVCPPEDVAERTKQAHKNSMIRNNLADTTTPNNNNNNQSGRNLKRVSSAPPMQNVAIGEFQNPGENRRNIISNLMAFQLMDHRHRPCRRPCELPSSSRGTT